MAWTPISNAVIQYAKDAAGTSASGYYLKFYASGTSTPFNMASASDGSGLLAKCQINSLGYPINGSGDVFIPHVDQDYRIVLYPTSADADANTFANAVFDIDNIPQQITGDISSFVKFTDLSANSGSSLVNFIQAGAGAVSRTLQSKFRDYINVKDFGAVGDYDINTGTGTDDTAAFQAALAAAGNLPVYVPALAYGKAYLITDELNIDDGQALIGEFHSRAISNASNRFHNTTIVFKPTSAKDCLVCVLPTSSYSQSHQIRNIMLLAGNSNARHGIAVNKAAQSTFENISINGFQRSLYMRYTLTNTFRNIQCVNASVEHILYDNIDGASISTTDVFDTCSFTLAPMGGTLKYAQCIRFNNCLFESLNTGALDIYKDCVGIMITNGYAEDVPAVSNSSNYFCQVGVNGTAKQTAPQLTIYGGFYGGANTGGQGVFLKVDDVDYVGAIGAFATRYTNYVTTTANTPNYRVQLEGAPRQAITTLYNDSIKIVGTYQNGQLNGSSSPRVNAGIVKGNTGIASGLVAGDATTGTKAQKLPIYDSNETFIGYAQVYV